MPSLKDFIAALQATWSAALVALIGCSIVVAGNWYKVPFFTDAPTSLTTTAAIVGSFAFSILAVNLVYSASLAYRGWWTGRVRKGQIREAVESCPDGEKEILAYLVTSGRQAFAAKWNDRRLIPLVTKGIVQRLDGNNDLLAWPFLVRKDVWSYLQENRHNFVCEDADIVPDPFHSRNSQ